MTKVSVITPVRAKHDHEAGWLHEAIASVYGQGYDDWEHIVVNDRSPASLAAVKAAWPHVRWLNAEGKGVSAARNQAAEAAEGELLLPLDGDDKFAKGAIGRMVEVWPGSGIVYTDTIYFSVSFRKETGRTPTEFRAEALRVELPEIAHSDRGRPRATARHQPAVRPRALSIADAEVVVLILQQAIPELHLRDLTVQAKAHLGVR